MENLIVEWSAAASKLPSHDGLARKRPVLEGKTSWYGNRKLIVAAEALAKPGYYVLAAEANGETAFAPIRVEDGK